MKHEFIRTHITATPFDNPHIKRIIGHEMNHQNKLRQRRITICDPFARESFTTSAPQGLTCITNDINPEMPTHYHLEAHDFARLMVSQGQEFDLILWDPPYNLSQLKRQYEGIGKELEYWQTLSPFGEAKDIISRCLKPGGSIVSFGFGSRCGFGENRGLTRMAIYNLEPAGTENRYNIQVVVERKLQHQLMNIQSKQPSDTDEESLQRLNHRFDFNQSLF